MKDDTKETSKGRFRLKIGAAVGGLLAALIVATIAAHTSQGNSPMIDPMSFQRVTLGMCYDEVEKLLNSPDGDYTNGRASTYLFFDLRSPLPPHVKQREWVGEEFIIEVWFDEEDRVVGAQLGTVILRSSWLREITDGLRDIRNGSP